MQTATARTFARPRPRRASSFPARRGTTKNRSWSPSRNGVKCPFNDARSQRQIATYLVPRSRATDDRTERAAARWPGDFVRQLS